MTERTGMDGTDVAAGGRTVTITDLLRIPLRRWRLPLAGALAGLLAGIAYLLLPATYEGVAVVAVRPVVTNPFSYPGPGADRVVNMTVENGLATGSDVIAAVSAATGQTATAARAGLIVELPAGTQVLRFRYRAPTATGALSGANAAANAFLRVRQGLYQGQRDSMVASYDASIAKITAEHDKIRRGLPKATTTSNSQPPSVTAQLDQLRGLDDQLSQLAQRRADTAAVNVMPGTITRVAAPPATSSRDVGVLYALLALLGGALVGAVAAYGIEGFDRRIRSGADAAAASGLPILAELHRRRFGHDRVRAAADLRYLALAVLGQLGPVPHRRIVLLAPRAGDTDPGVATGLALALAEQGNTIRWKDLTAAAAASRSLVLAAAAGVLPAAAGPDETAEMMLKPSQLMVEGRRRARAVRVGPGEVWLDPPTTAVDTMITVLQTAAAEHDDSGVRAALEAVAVVVVRRDHTRVSDLARLAGTLRLTGARALGVVLVSGHD